MTALAGLAEKRWVKHVLLPVSLGMCAVVQLVPLFLLPALPAFTPVHGVAVSWYKLLAALLLLGAALYGTVAGGAQARLTLSAVAVYGVGLFASVWSIDRFEPIRTGWQDEYGSALLVLLFAVMMARRNRSLLEENERLTQHLHEEVEEKTQKLVLLVNERKASLAGMVHDLKSPLTSIVNYVQLVQQNDILVDGEARELLQVVEQKCDDMSGRIRALQDYASEDESSMRMEEIDLKELLTAFHRANQPDIEVSGPDFLLELPARDCRVYGDASRLNRVLENLVYNAAGFTPPDGRILLSLARDGAWACVRVSDNGRGIAPGAVERVFERYYTTRREQGGRGLGLSSSREIVREHGGDITVISQEGKGSTFQIRLPLLPAPGKR